MVPDRALVELTSRGYLILGVCGDYCFAVQAVNGVDRYTALKYEAGAWVTLLR
jgi:hypothetical protein